MTATATKRTKVLDDVLSFAQVGLGLELYDWQLEADTAIDRSSQYERIKVALVAPNGSGKTQRVVGVSTLRWLNRYPRGRVIITSADAKQLDSQLMPAVSAHAGKFPGWEFLGRQIRTPLGGFMLAFTTDEPSRAEGHHRTKDSPLLIIIDEAKSIDPAIFAAFDRCTYNVILYISSPGLKQGRFYQAFTEHRENFLLTTQVGLTDCPHISQERIKDVIDTYGEFAQYTRSTLYGEFMNEDESQPMAISFERLSSILQVPPHAKISRHEYSAFCDFAAGGDENVLAIRSGNKLLELIAWRERDTTAAVGRFIIEFRKHSLRAEQIWGDGGGLGHPMCDMLQAAGWPINRFDFGSKAHNEAVFFNRGAEIWGMFARRIEKGELVLINDPTLVSQLTTRKIFYDNRGRVRLESKEDMRGRGLKSPDRADAVIAAFNHGNQSFADFVKMADPWSQLDRYYDGLAKNDLGSDRGTERIQRELGAWAGD